MKNKDSKRDITNSIEGAFIEGVTVWNFSGLNVDQHLTWNK